ncbi:MAG: flagellar protein FlaG [Thermodesulfobacteriota bacterium]|nr:MAG: flagellar protein FlaG [Thermodesulfobacteriota bacterium]
MDIEGVDKIARGGAEKVFEPVSPVSRKKEAEVRAGVFEKPERAGDRLQDGKVDEVAAEVQIRLKRLNTELRFEVDNDSRKTIVRIVDAESGKVIRQIPSEDLLAIRNRMDDLIGVLFDSKA